MTESTGVIELSGKQLNSLQFAFPLRLIATKPHPLAPAHRTIYMVSHGGGIVSGDRMTLRVSLQGRCSLSLLTQGTTKIFKRTINEPVTAGGNGYSCVIPSRVSARQRVVSNVSSESLLCVLPGATVPFADSAFEQAHTVHLESHSASLVLLDWFTAGRLSRGEVWEFAKYDSAVRVLIDGVEVIRDRWLIEDEDLSSNGLDFSDNACNNETSRRAKSYASRMHRYKCYATMILMGSRVQNLVKSAEDAFETVQLTDKETQPLVWSMSRLPESCGVGVMFRAASLSSEEMRAFVKTRLIGLEDEIGENLFAREI